MRSRPAALRVASSSAPRIRPMATPLQTRRIPTRTMSACPAVHFARPDLDPGLQSPTVLQEGVEQADGDQIQLPVAEQLEALVLRAGAETEEMCLRTQTPDHIGV